MNEKAARPEVWQVNMGQGMAYLDDGRVVPITNWFDTDGDDCGPEEAVVCVAGHEDIGWYTIDLRERRYVTVH